MRCSTWSVGARQRDSEKKRETLATKAKTKFSCKLILRDVPMI